MDFEGARVAGLDFSGPREWIHTNAQGMLISDWYAPTMAQNRLLGWAQVGYDKRLLDARLKARLWATVKRLILVATSTLLIAILISLMLSWSLSRPIKALAQAARAIASGHLDYRTELSGRNDELGHLAREINEMAKQLKALDEMKQSFLESVTHDLRAPLTSIIGHVSIFLENQLGELDERQRTALETVFTSARKLSRLIDDILDLSRLEAGQMDFELKPVRMDELLSELNDLVSVLADQSKISLELDIENGLPPVSGDREQLLRVIMNLVSNALKFTPENGRIRVGLRRDSAATLRVSVMDTGMGIPKDKLEKIFDKFFQVSETKDSSRRKGSGLGLSICRKIIQAHNGRIWAESDLGHGSTFHFTLPLSPEPEGRKTADLSTA